MDKIKKHPVLFFLSIASLVVGLWFILDNPSKVIGVIYTFIGICLIMSGVLKMLTNQKKYTYDGLINVVVGILIMFLHNLVFTIILGAIFMIFPLARIVVSENKAYTFKRELPFLIIGLVIALCADLFAVILVKISGVILLILAVCLFVLIFVSKEVYNQFMFFGDEAKNALGFDNVFDYEESEDDE